MSVNSLIRSRSTWMPTTRATDWLSPMNSRCSPNRCRFKISQSSTRDPQRPQELHREVGDPADEQRVDPGLVDRAQGIGGAARQAGGEAAPEELGRQRGDDRRHADHGHDEAVDEAHERPAQKRQRHAQPWLAQVLDRIGQEVTREGDHGGEGEVDLARSDDQRQPERQEQHGRHGREEREIDPRAQEDLRCRRHEHGRERQQHGDDRQALETRDPAQARHPARMLLPPQPVRSG